MRNILVTSLFLVCMKAHSQNTLTTNNMLPTDINVFTQINSKSSGRTIKYDEIKGSPYVKLTFTLAKFGDNYENAPARYNSYTDEIEYQKNGEIYLLPKKTDIKKIQFINTKDILTNLETNDEFSGYFFEIVDGKYSLYKKIKTKFIDIVPARNSYDTDKPAEFRTFAPLYYIKTENGFIKGPKNQKQVLNAISDKKDSLEKFFKENKIKFDQEEDLKKLVLFLNN